MSANTYLAPSTLVPGFLLITGISNSYPAIVSITDSDENTYVVGQLVHLNIPAPYKMFQADQKTAEILAIDGSDFSINLDTTLYDTFVVPGPYVSQPATIAPAGSRNMAFENSKVASAFRSLSNSGN